MLYKRSYEAPIPGHIDQMKTNMIDTSTCLLTVQKCPRPISIHFTKTDQVADMVWIVQPG